MKGINEEEQKWATLLTSCGTAMLVLAEMLAAPDNIQNVSYDWLIKLLTAHFTLQPTKLVQ